MKNATSHVEQIDRWWATFPNANIGLATGEPFGVDVLDVDPRDTGSESLWELEHQYGELPSTVMSLTGGGGSHIFGLHVAGLKNQTGQIAPGLDFKTTGGYVVLPPSRHISGRYYTWEGAGRPNEVEIAQFPGWMLVLIRDASAPSGNSTTGTAKPVEDKIPRGKRNSRLTLSPVPCGAGV